MSDLKTSLVCLIVDDEEDITDMISFVIESRFRIGCDLAFSGNQAIKILKENPKKYSFIVSDYRMPDGGGLDIWKYIKEANLSIPFILCSSDKTANIPELKNEKIAGSVEKPFFQEPLKKIISDILTEKVPKETLDDMLRSIEISSSKDAEVKQYDDDFQKVNIRLLKKGKIAPCDIYVRINTSKYIKFFRSKDAFALEKLTQFQNRQLNYLYISRRDVSAFYDFILNELSQKLKKAQDESDVSSELELFLSSNIQDTVNDLCARIGFNLEVEKLAKKSIQMALNMVSKNPNLEEVVKSITKGESYITSHSLFLCFVSSWLAKTLEWDSEQTILKLTFSSMLHDVTINNESLAKIRSEEELEKKKDLFTSDEVRLWRSHAGDASQVCTLFSEIPRGVDAIISQHHDQFDGFTFPESSKNSMQPLAILFIIAHDIVDYIIQDNNEKFDMEVFLAANKSKYSHGPYLKIYQSLLKITERKSAS